MTTATTTTTNPSGDTLADWAAWWIEARCACKVGYLPCRRLAMDHGGAHRVADVVARLRCPRCRERPVVALVDDMRGTGEAGARIFGAAQRMPISGCG